MEDTTYNGWKNYETWACKLWLDNDETIHKATLKLARKAQKEADKAPSHELNAQGRLSLDIEVFIDSQRAIVPTFWLFGDLLDHAIGCIDFREIAAAYLEEITN